MTFSLIRARNMLSGAALLAAGLLTPAHEAHAVWPQGMANAEVVRSLTAPNGDIFIAGHFSGETFIGDVQLNSAGLQDIFVARLDASGRVLWAQSAGGELVDTVGGIALDASNNLYVVGSYYSRIWMGGDTLNSRGGRDGYVARISAQGQWAWARRVGGSGADNVADVVVLPGDSSQIPPVADSLIITGHYLSSITFGDTGGASTSRSLSISGSGRQSDTFLANVTVDGNTWNWAVNRRETTGVEEGLHLALDSNQRLHLVGQGEGATPKVHFDQNFQVDGSLSNWNVSGGGVAHSISQTHLSRLRSMGIGNEAVPGLAMRGGAVSLTRTGTFNIPKGPVQVQMRLYRGKNAPYSFLPFESGGYNYVYASERPDAGEDLVFEFLGANGSWHEITRFAGNGTAGQYYDLMGPASIWVDRPEIHHSEVRFRLRQLGASGPLFDWWHVARLSVTGYVKRGFVQQVTNLRSGSPTFGTIKYLSDGSVVNDMKVRKIGTQDRIYLAGTYSSGIAVSNTVCASVGGSGGFVSILNVSADFYGCELLEGVAGAEVNALAADDDRVYVTGAFTGSAMFDQELKGDPHSRDVFVAALEQSGGGMWAWSTGGNRNTGNPAAPAGGPGEDSARAISIAGGGSLYVGGRFQGIAQFGPVDSLAATGDTDGFLVKLGTDGRFFQPETWTIGVPVPPPSGACDSGATAQPEFFLDGQQIPATGADYRWFAWVFSSANKWQLIPLQPTPEVEVRWRTTASCTDPANAERVVTLGANAWPTQACSDIDIPGSNRPDGCYQSHIVGAPVEAKPSGYQIVGDPITPSSGGSGATIDGDVFNATRSGYSVIMYVFGPSVDQSAYPTFVEVVRSLPYQLVPGFQDNVSVEIGQKITHPAHNEPNRSGWVINELAYYDGHGVNAAYNRAARLGSIIPVNRYSSSRPQDFGRELAVAWYRRNGKGVYWASRAVRYQPRWPYDPARIVIASEQGSEFSGQAVLTAAAFPQAHIYVQNDFMAPGFNPNDEHAMMAPSSTGSGYDAVFALRSDFGGADDPAAASDPYVLLKYYNNGAQDWNYKIYRVQATGAGYNRFRYSGTAGTTVSPPYPVRLLPGCAQTFVDGQAVGEPAPPPFFQDHKNQLWAKSAGSGKVHYFYPMQPGFYQDNDYNDANDYQAGECTPWLARLPESQGGAASAFDPIPVEYTIVWPENPPLLVAGETLLTPKAGLPDIYHQAAVSIVYDGHRDEVANAGPADTLAQLVDPLNPRWVRLSQLPAEIAQEMRSDGLYNIVGSSDGVLKMPASIGERIHYDAMNQRLVFHGVFDETGVGDPKLLLNVMSKRERVLLKRLNGGDGREAEDSTKNCVSTSGCTWDEAVEALYRLSRNPSGITKICRSATIGDNRERQCTDLDEHLSPDELLIAYRDPNNNGMLQPLTVLGGGAALTAGAATDSGYMTLAFNNDPSLGTLPVSLEVIRVGCLDSVSPPIHAPYQGQINVISPDNIFDEQLVLRHSGDFGGNPDALQFEWYFHPDANGTPPMPLPSPETGQMHGWVQFPVADPNGAVEISIEGANIQTLSDNWYLARYRGLSTCNNTSQWSLWAGQPGATPIEPRAQLAEGWVKRVLSRLNPFEARVQDFGQAETNNFASMLIQLGERYSGPVALNNDPDNLNSMGLIEAYTTVMRRALQLSADATPPIDYGPANAAILLVASRLVDFYTLLGNEAYADAQDPTIGIDADAGTINLNPSIFTFQNQLESPLDEELVLLRGRDDAHGPVAASPVYNRLFWNFTRNNGEVAYALSYNISDQNQSGVIDEYDARIMFPQGHGDAWGHYLTATKTYYGLLRHPFFSWNPQSEAVLVAGAPINVDYLDERQFAQTAAAKARAGAEIVDLTYRKAYVEDPNGQWQGYDDTDPQRAWGLSEWGRRSGMAAYFDWVTVNAVLPETDDNPNHVGIQKIDRSRISELNEIAGHYRNIQRQVDKADAGLNPLGLAKGMVPFDIDPAQLTSQNKTQFEQVWERAMAALDNALSLWDYANQLNNQLRRIQNGVDAQAQVSTGQETSFANQLIEIFGYPYADDIGPGGTYPAGYNGPDMYHYMYVDVPALAGTSLDFDTPVDDLGVTKINEFKGYYGPSANGMGFFNAQPTDKLNGTVGADCAQFPMAAGCPLGDTPDDELLEVEYVTIDSPDFGLWFTKPESWSGSRRAPGRLQQTLHQMFQARIALKQATLEYDKLRLDIEDQINAVRTVFNTQVQNLNVAIDQRKELKRLTDKVQAMRTSATVIRRVGDQVSMLFDKLSECIPDRQIAGLAASIEFSGIKCGVAMGGVIASTVGNVIADGIEIGANHQEDNKEDVSELAGIKSMLIDANLEMYNTAGEIDALLRQEPVLRSEMYARAEAIKQLQGDYLATMAEGLRVYEQLLTFRRTGAAATQEYRYKDMAFRIFRNDALQKYRASFDLAARYVYMAASAYDYETNLLGSNAKAGQTFLTNVVRQRSLGQVLNGEPMAGSPGLADTMAQLKLNFAVLKGQMGFNNPLVETNRFSLRRELFRIPAGEEGDEQWRKMLDGARVADLWQVPEFRRLARPFAPESSGPQPGLVLEFSTNVTFGLNYFGWDLGPQDSTYDSSRFATRIRSVGAWFGNYAGLPLAETPNVYLMPVGADVLRAPDPLDFTVREWQVIDQAVPIPFPVGAQDIARFDWNPGDTLSESRVAVRRYPQMRAYHFSEPFNDEQVTADSRLIGRSVWNRRWLLMIPGGTFLSDPNEGLDTFIHGAKVPGGGGARDGNGVDDIRIFFKTYSYSGN